MVTTPTAWETYASEEGGYSVAFPGKPETMTQTIIEEDLDPPRTTLIHRQWFTPAIIVEYQVYWYLPHRPADAAPDGLKALVEEIDDEFAYEAETNGKILKVSGFPGLEATWEVTGGVRRRRAFLVGGRMIWQIFKGTAGSENSASAEKFFSSLNLSD